MKKLNREEVYELINEERKYQDKVWGGAEYDANRTISDWLMFIRKYINDAENAVFNFNTEEAMDAIRKITAIGVAAMESKGCPKRN